MGTKVNGNGPELQEFKAVLWENIFGDDDDEKLTNLERRLTKDTISEMVKSLWTLSDVKTKYNPAFGRYSEDVYKAVIALSLRRSKSRASFRICYRSLCPVPFRCSTLVARDMQRENLKVSRCTPDLK